MENRNKNLKIMKFGPGNQTAQGSYWGVYMAKKALYFVGLYITILVQECWKHLAFIVHPKMMIYSVPQKFAEASLFSSCSD